jgi:hypothetical protein
MVFSAAGSAVDEQPAIASVTHADTAMHMARALYIVGS